MFMDLIRVIPAYQEDPGSGGHHDHEEDDEDHDDHEEHHHDHDHHHDADDIFSTVVLKDVRLTAGTPEAFIEKLQNGACGRILRGKGYVRDRQGDLLYVDVTPADSSFRKADPEKAGEKADVFVVIGCGLDEEKLRSVV
jgi:G3E family GTPase